MLEKYYAINQATGIGITFLQNGALQINACSITVDQKKLSFDQKLIDVPALIDLKKQVPAKAYIALNLSGKGILQKQIERIEEITSNNFSKVLPNGKIDDFYIQNFISGEFSFVSVIRKTEADKWIDQVKDLGFIPLTLSVGPFPVQHIIPQLNVYDADVIFSGHNIRRNEQSQWLSYKYDEQLSSPFPLKIESEHINEHLLLSYAAAFQLVLSGKIDPVKAKVPEMELKLQQVIGNKKLQVKGALILAVFFVLLLINFLVFSSLNNANNQLAEQLSRSNQSSINVQDISEQIKQKEGLLKELGWDGGINKAALVDQLAALLPEGLSWTEVAVNPIDMSSSRVQKSLTFFNREIRVTGTSDKIIPVNEWMARVKTKAWVKNIQLDSYLYNNELNTGQFTVIIKY